MIARNGRTADHSIEPLFLERWSPRTFTGEAMPDPELFRLFEAARWAPSSSNRQPWRFLYARRDTPDWPLFFELLNPGNQRWADAASVLLAVVSKRTAPVKDSDEVRENYTHSFDTGAACMSLALQAAAMGWAAHAMAGYDLVRAVAELGVPDDYRMECMIAVGRLRVDPDLAAKPNERAPQTSFVRAGRFGR